MFRRQTALPTPGTRPRRPIPIGVIILVAMFFSLGLLWLSLSSGPSRSTVQNLKSGSVSIQILSEGDWDRPTSLLMQVATADGNWQESVNLASCMPSGYPEDPFTLQRSSDGLIVVLSSYHPNVVFAVVEGSSRQVLYPAEPTGGQGWDSFFDGEEALQARVRHTFQQPQWEFKNLIKGVTLFENPSRSRLAQP